MKRELYFNELLQSNVSVSSQMMGVQFMNLLHFTVDHHPDDCLRAKMSLLYAFTDIAALLHLLKVLK